MKMYDKQRNIYYFNTCELNKSMYDGTLFTVF